MAELLKNAVFNYFWYYFMCRISWITH